MKKGYKFLAITTALVTLGSSSVFAAGGIMDAFKAAPKAPQKLEQFVSDFNLMVPNSKNELVKFALKQAPKNISGRSCLALRDVADALGKQIEWDKDNRAVIINSGEKLVVLPIDKKVFYADGKIYSYEIPATIDAATGRTYLPLRAIGEVLGYDVNWNKETKTAELKKGDVNAAVPFKAVSDVEASEVKSYFEDAAKRLGIPGLQAAVANISSTLKDKVENIKEKAEEIKKDATEKKDEVVKKAEEVKDEAAKKAEEIKDKVEKKTEEVKDKVEKKAEEAKDKVEKKTEEVKELTTEELSKIEKESGFKFFKNSEAIYAGLKAAINEKKNPIKFVAPKAITVGQVMSASSKLAKEFGFLTSNVSEEDYKENSKVKIFTVEFVGNK